MNHLPTIADSLSKLHELNWDFPGDKSDSPFSDLHFHPGRFVPQIPAALIGTLTQLGDTVLDPFCGSGTTLVEAQRLGRNAVGIDLNPVACLISKIKTKATVASEIELELTKFLKELAVYRLENISSLQGEIPSTVQLSKWYHPETGRQLVNIWSCIQSKSNADFRDVALFCFSATLLSCCGETRHWGYVCDNVRPLERRYVDAHTVFVERAEALMEAFRRREQRSVSLEQLMASTVAVREGDAATELKSLRSDSVDLVVTSPPYFGVVDYIKAQRLSFEWFGREIEPYRRGEIGARSKRHRLSALSQYLNELSETISEIHRVLKAGHIAAFVIGESGRRQGALKEFLTILQSEGFTIEMSITRNIGLLRRQPASLASEELLVCKKR